MDGRLERSLEVRLKLLRRGSRVDPARIDWSVEPASRAELTSRATLRLLEAGPLELEARLDEATVRRTLEVAVPPRIVFDMRDSEGGARDVYSAALDGRELRRLTDSPATDADPAATPGGPDVVFTSFRDGNGELYRMSAGGGTPVRLTRTAAPEAEPALSPDGSRLAFTRPVGGIPKLWTAGADGSEATRRTTGFGSAGVIEADPTWGPGSRSVVFMATRGGEPDLFRWSGGSGVAPVLEAEGPDLEPAWSPDGRAVAFAADRGAGADLHLLRLDGGEIRRLTERDGNEGQPAWTGDGRIVYTVFTEEGSELWWLDPEAGNEAEQVEIPLPDRDPENASGGPEAVPDRAGDDALEARGR